MSFYRLDASKEDVPPLVENRQLVTPSGSNGEEARRLRSAIAAHVADLLGEEDPEFVNDLVETFCGSVHELVLRARGAQASQDLATAGKVAHQLKGSAANVGLTEIESAWYRVEAGVREGDPTVLGLALANAAEMTERAANLLDGGA
jgi:HPt (histidine-containing phosphotransfer) domain-containing protein